MKEFDFLPEWYKDGKRRQSHVRRQYIALAAVFLAMMIFNLTATQRAGQAAAEVGDLDEQRMRAETVVHEFDTLTRELNRLKAKANLIEQMDSRIDMAATLAEMSHIIGESIIVRKAELVAEPFAPAQEKGKTKGSGVRLAGKGTSPEADKMLGSVKFRIVLTGVAAHPADVPNLVCKLDESPYFQRVRPSFYGNARIQAGGRLTPGLPEGGTAAKGPGRLDVTEFEIVCYLANYVEMDER